MPAVATLTPTRWPLFWPNGGGAGRGIGGLREGMRCSTPGSTGARKSQCFCAGGVCRGAAQPHLYQVFQLRSGLGCYRGAEPRSLCSQGQPSGSVPGTALGVTCTVGNPCLQHPAVYGCSQLLWPGAGLPQCCWHSAAKDVSWPGSCSILALGIFSPNTLCASTCLGTTPVPRRPWHSLFPRTGMERCSPTLEHW